MTQRAVLELTAPGVLDEDLTGLDVALARRDLVGRAVTLRQLTSGAIPLQEASIVAGTLPFVYEGLRRLGIDRPPPLDYLDAATELLGRRVRATTLGAASELLDLRGEPLFLKPRGRAKQFTGRVVRDPTDLRAIAVRSPSTPVWCCDVVDFVSEFRVFVRYGRVVGCRFYEGDPSRPPPPDTVEAIVATLTDRLPAGCAVDIGVASDGRTLLVEANDGFSLGRYGLPAEPYLDVLLARWNELVGPDVVGRIDSADGLRDE